jgi:hypothetical protein
MTATASSRSPPAVATSMGWMARSPIEPAGYAVSVFPITPDHENAYYYYYYYYPLAHPAEGFEATNPNCSVAPPRQLASAFWAHRLHSDAHLRFPVPGGPPRGHRERRRRHNHQNALLSHSIPSTYRWMLLVKWLMCRRNANARSGLVAVLPYSLIPSAAYNRPTDDRAGECHC